ncbi:septal ring lytic transglycosylase RlpA family protein [Collimonas fungivorans]|nr:septal ring lytic transglycosylase RlpA family protein [Collimonas fungivorans]
MSGFFQTRGAHVVWLLAAWVAMPAAADTAPDLLAGHEASKDATAVAGTTVVSDTISPSRTRGESALPPAAVESGEHDLSPEQAIDSDFSLDESTGLRSDPGTVVQRGKASWYGPGFHGRKSASGERFNMYSMTAAHPSLPLQSWVLVRNVRNNRTALVKVTDRGPYRSKRIIDVSYAAAKQLGFVRNGTAQIELRKLSSSEASEAAQSPAK